MLLYLLELRGISFYLKRGSLLVVVNEKPILEMGVFLSFFDSPAGVLF